MTENRISRVCVDPKSIKDTVTLVAEPWSDQEWADWRANNLRLMSEGWTLHNDQMVDGSVQVYAVKDGVRVDREPRWIVE